MSMALTATEDRLQRLVDARDLSKSKLEDVLRTLENDNGRDPSEAEASLMAQYRDDIKRKDDEIDVLASDLEINQKARDASAVIRVTSEADPVSHAAPHRTFSQYARDVLITQRSDLVSLAGLSASEITRMQAEAQDRISRTLENVTSTTVEGLIQPTHMTEIMDIIGSSRPVVNSARSIPLDRGSITYPQITQRPQVSLQSAEKTEAGTLGPKVVTRTVTAETYLGATNISWQAINWSNPDVLNLYFTLAAEEYARQTESATCEVLESAVSIGTVGTSSGRLGTTGTESFGAWRTAVSAAVAAIYSATSGRHHTNTLYLSANRFFQLATLGTDQVAQMSPIGSVDLGSMTGNFFGVNVVGSYGFDQDTAILGDSGALLVGENPGSPVEMRVVEPNIGGYEVGIIGAFKAAVFDGNRFYHLGTHL